MTPQQTIEALVGRPLTSAETGLMSSRADAALAQSLSSGRTVQSGVPVTALAAWCAATGLRGRIADIAVDATSPMRSAALAMLDLLSWPAGVLDLSASAAGQGNIGMLGAWVAAGIVTAAQRAALISMAATPAAIDCNTISSILNGG